ncbi:hypothetical protein G6F37_001664 [Rhizopus arrhizus]|nr:hypothetical protein G6F38_001982 [Rhizopus arrhizus]KAG1162968.1 hypothetical protein G6F37_001664 [Rhizopus arrhizus]
MAKSSIGKKRVATTEIQKEPAKVSKNQVKKVEEEPKNENGGLFDDLDEEMDPEELEQMLKQVNDEDDGSDQAEESDNFMDEDSEMDEQSDKEEEEEEEEEQENDAEGTNGEEETNIPPKEKTTSERFRDSFMTKITQAFGTDLDQIRQESTLNGPRLNVLIDSLEAGIDIFSSLEQEIILADEEKTQNL